MLPLSSLNHKGQKSNKNGIKAIPFWGTGLSSQDLHASPGHFHTIRIEIRKWYISSTKMLSLLLNMFFIGFETIPISSKKITGVSFRHLSLWAHQLWDSNLRCFKNGGPTHRKFAQDVSHLYSSGNQQNKNMIFNPPKFLSKTNIYPLKDAIVGRLVTSH